jgi:multimeric flavodoxin WrbA
MPIQVLGLMGSPRKNGNTDILVSKVLEGAQSKGALIRTIDLGDLRIRECDGCHACWAGQDCIKHDDMNQLYIDIIQSNVFVFGTPVYWYGPTAIMKGFIDRLVYFNTPQNRELIRGKSVIVVIPFEETNKEIAQPVVEFFRRCLAYLELNIVAELVVPGLSRKGEVAERDDVKNAAFELGVKWV